MTTQIKDVYIIEKNHDSKQNLKVRDNERRLSKPIAPLTRYQKIRSKKAILPASSQNKIVFISNTQANGFKMENLSIFGLQFDDINVQKMFKQINKVCYQQWLLNKNKLKQNSFCKINNIIKVLYWIAMLIILCMFIFTYNQLTEPIIISVYVIGAMLAIGLSIAFFIYFCEMDQYDADFQMKKAIKNKLVQFNKNQFQNQNERPRFIWTCQTDCIWIAIGLVDYSKKDQLCV